MTTVADLFLQNCQLVDVTTRTIITRKDIGIQRWSTLHSMPPTPKKYVDLRGRIRCTRTHRCAHAC